MVFCAVWYRHLCFYENQYTVCSQLFDGFLVCLPMWDEKSPLIAYMYIIGL